MRDAVSVVGELRALPSERGLSPPFVLVGHSLGGLYIQYFARNFPDDVAGLVLVDSTHGNNSNGYVVRHRPWSEMLPPNRPAACLKWSGGKPKPQRSAAVRWLTT
jgi:pimeloyl-ACP methyl ester carboxylesterase